MEHNEYEGLVTGIQRQAYGSESLDNDAAQLSSNGDEALFLSAQDGHQADVDSSDGRVLTIYGSRWYVLFVVCLLTMIQNCVWNTWGPIDASAELAYNISAGELATLTNWGALTFLVSCLPFMWYIERGGMRRTIIICAVLVVAGCVIRLFTWFGDDVSRYTRHAGQILNGLAGPPGMFVSSFLSATWFPLQERNLATSIQFISQGLGVGLSFAVAPIFVPNNAMARNATTTFDAYVTDLSNSSQPKVQAVRKEIQNLNYFYAAVVIATLVMVVAYLPDKPPTPPTHAAATERIDFKTSTIQLFTSWSCWVAMLPYVIAFGALGNWQGIVATAFSNVTVSQDEISSVGISMTIGSVILGLALGKLADVFASPRASKVIIVIVWLVGVFSFVWCCLISQNLIRFSLWQLFTSATLTNSCLSGVGVLMFEAACETAFPVSESFVTGMMSFLTNLFAGVYLSVAMFVNFGDKGYILNWLLLAFFLIPTPFVFKLKPASNRFRLDAPSEDGRTVESRAVTYDRLSEPLDG